MKRFILLLTILYPFLLKMKAIAPSSRKGRCGISQAMIAILDIILREIPLLLEGRVRSGCNRKAIL